MYEDGGVVDYYERPFYFHAEELWKLRENAEPVVDLGPTFSSTYYRQSTTSVQQERPMSPPDSIKIKQEEEYAIDSTEEQMITEASKKKEGGLNKLFSMVNTISMTPLKQELIEKEEEEEEDIFQLSPQCKEYSLFQYIDDSPEGHKRNMTLSFKEIYTTCYCKLIEIIDDLDEASITVMINNFVNTILLQLISQDKKGVKVLEIMNKFHELYISSTKNNLGKNDYARFDSLNRLIDVTFKQACDIKNDPIYLNYSQTKQRGRRREEDKLETPNEVDSIRCNSISAAVASDQQSPPTSTSQMDGGGDTDPSQKKRATKSNKERKKRELIFHPPNDEYKVLLKTMKLINDSLPRETNHGGYQKELHQWIRDYEKAKSNAVSPPPVWPLWRLLRVICNMQYMTEIRLRKNLQTKGSIYHCDYSGERINDGDDIYIIELYENDIVRFIKWDINKTRPNREFESEELFKSNRMFFIKKTRCSPVSLFPTSFSPQYKAHYKSFFKDDEVKEMEKTTQGLMDYALSLTNNNHDMLIELDRLKGELRKQDYDLLEQMRYKFEDVTIETFNNDIINTVSHFYGVKHVKQVIKTMMDFVDYLIVQTDSHHGTDVIDHAEQFTSSVVSIFKGRDTVTLHHSGHLQVRLKNSTLLRGFMYINYKRRCQSLGYGKSMHDIAKLNCFHTKMMKSVEFDQAQYILIALFDYLFRIVY
jgi:hypothetical protein